MMKALQEKYETCNPYKKSGKRNVLILTGRERNKLPTLNDSNKEIVFDRTNHKEPAHVLQTINTLTALVKGWRQAFVKNGRRNSSEISQTVRPVEQRTVEKNA